MVIDSFKAVRDILGDAAALRTFVYDLAVHTAGWGATSLLVGEYTDAEIASHAEFAIADGIIRLTNRAPRADRRPRGRGAEAARRGLRHRRPLLRDRRGRARVLPARAEPRRHPPDRAAEYARPSAPRRASPGSTPCSAAGCRARARRSSRAGPGRARPSSACSSSSRARGTASRGSTSCWRRRPNQLRGIAQSLGWDLRPFEERGPLDAQLRLARRALDRPLPRSGAAARWSSSARGAPCSTA